VTGEGWGGDQLTPAVQARIDQCDSLIALLTRRGAKREMTRATVRVAAMAVRVCTRPQIGTTWTRAMA
jgi:hypothetical protein